MEKIFKEFEPNENQKLLNKFNSFYPEGKMSELRLNDLPKAVLKYFEANSRRFILPEKYKPGNFKRLLAVDYTNGDKTYIANQIKIYENDDDAIEDLSYLIDYRGGNNIGHAELRYNLQSDSEYFKNKPFVGYTATKEEYQRSGLAERRLFLMNALAKTLYDYPICSDTVISAEAKSLWEKLVQENKAKMIKEGKNDRYVMLD
jgi:hypothetical protein